MDNYLQFKAVRHSPIHQDNDSYYQYTKAVLSLNACGSFDTFPKIEYSKDKETWTELEINEDEIEIPVDSSVYFRNSSVNTSFSKGVNDYLFFIGKGFFEVSGNVMSLIAYEGDGLTIPCDYCFIDLFSSLGDRVNFDEIELPATTLRRYCYSRMFAKTGIVNPITLPAATLTEGCYLQMFYRCPYLIKSPELPATVLSDSCYEGMFDGCERLRTISTIAATTLSRSCFHNMFRNCSRVQQAFTLSAETVEDYCYTGMFSGCSILQTGVRIKATKSHTFVNSLTYIDTIEGQEPVTYTFPCFLGGQVVTEDVSYETWKDDYQYCITAETCALTGISEYPNYEITMYGLGAADWNTNMFLDCPNLESIDVDTYNFLKHNAWINGSTMYSEGTFWCPALPKGKEDGLIAMMAIPKGDGEGGESNWSVLYKE